MTHIRRFDPRTAKAAHENTILASPVIPEEARAPVGHAYGYLDRDGARMDAHAHPTYEFYLILEGEGYAEIDGLREPVRAGDYVEIPPNALHAMLCKGDRPFLWAAFWWALQ